MCCSPGRGNMTISCDGFPTMFSVQRPGSRFLSLIGLMLLVLFLVPNDAVSQVRDPDSLLQVIAAHRTEDKTKVHLLLTLADDWLRAGRPIDVSTGFCREAAALSKRLGHDAEYAWSLYGVAWGLITMESFGAAEDTLRLALKVAENLKDTVIILKVQTRLGKLQMRRGLPARALPWYGRQKETALSRGDTLEIIGAYQNMGAAYHALGQLGPAAKEWEKMLLLAEKTGNDEKHADAMMNIAMTMGNEMNEKAIEYLRASMDIYERIEDDLSASMCAHNLGEILLECHRYADAVQTYEHAGKLALACHDEEMTYNAELGLARAHLGEGNHAAAADICREILPRVEGRANKEFAIWYCLTMVDALAHSDPASALHYAERAWRYTEEHDDLQLRMLAYGKLIEGYGWQKDYRNAYEHFRVYIALKDSIEKESNTKVIAEITARYDLESREKAIRILQQEKTLREAEMRRQGEELLRRKAESDRNRQTAQLLARRQELHIMAIENREMELQLRSKELQLEKKEKEKRGKEIALLHKDNALQSSITSRERGMRNSLIIGLLLALVVGFLGVKRVQARRTEASLRAEAAEFQAQAAEYQAKASESEMLRVQADSERRQREAHKEFSRQLIASQEQERRRIAGELHDQLGQDLLVIRNAMLATVQEGHGDESLNDAVQTAAAMLENVRRLARDLRPFQLDRYGLTKAIEAMLGRIGKNSPTRFTVELDPVDGLFPKEQEINLYRIVQESVNNIIRHAGATEATIRLVRDEESVEMVIADNGKGIVLKDGVDTAGFGLQGMRQRADILGGSMTIRSADGTGTTIHFIIPLIPQTQLPITPTEEEPAHV
jgi:signal transduction histidine kinase